MNRLQQFREHAGISRSALAAQLGVSRAWVWALETKRREPGRRLALAIRELTASSPFGPIEPGDWDPPVESLLRSSSDVGVPRAPQKGSAAA